MLPLNHPLITKLNEDLYLTTYERHLKNLERHQQITPEIKSEFNARLQTLLVCAAARRLADTDDNKLAYERALESLMILKSAIIIKNERVVDKFFTGKAHFFNMLMLAALVLLITIPILCNKNILSNNAGAILSFCTIPLMLTWFVRTILKLYTHDPSYIRESRFHHFLIFELREKLEQYITHDAENNLLPLPQDQHNWRNPFIVKNEDYVVDVDAARVISNSELADQVLTPFGLPTVKEEPTPAPTPAPIKELNPFELSPD